MFIGHISCPKDGQVHITDPSTVTVYYSIDAEDQYTEVVCAKCGGIVSANIGLESLSAFRQYDCNFKVFGEQFSAINEEEISGWDIEKDLTNNGLR